MLGVARSLQKLRDEHELAEQGGAEEGASAMVSPMSSTRELLSRSTLQGDGSMDVGDAVRPPSVVAAAAPAAAAPAPAPVDDVAKLVADATAAVPRPPGDLKRPRALPPVKHSRRVSDGSEVDYFMGDDEDRQ